LVSLIADSEELDPDADSFEPNLAPVDFDDEAMAEALPEKWDDVENDDG
jgi:hypothetical protein